MGRDWAVVPGGFGGGKWAGGVGDGMGGRGRLEKVEGGRWVSGRT